MMMGMSTKIPPYGKIDAETMPYKRTPSNLRAFFVILTNFSFYLFIFCGHHRHQIHLCCRLMNCRRRMSVSQMNCRHRRSVSLMNYRHRRNVRGLMNCCHRMNERGWLSVNLNCLLSERGWKNLTCRTTVGCCWKNQIFQTSGKVLSCSLGCCNSSMTNCCQKRSCAMGW